MLFEKHGLSVWITDSNNNKLLEYQLQEISDDAIQCWIPSTDGSNFQIKWKMIKNPHPRYDLRTVPYLDGVRMTGTIWSKEDLIKGCSGTHDMQYTGTSTARLYEFGKRTLTDRDDCPKPDQSLLKDLNTIKLIFDWGREGKPKPPRSFYDPRELGPIHEKAAKKGHSGAAKLGKTITVRPNSSTIPFTGSENIKPVTFVFCYAPEDWLQARDIIPRSPEPESQRPQKRARSTTPDVVDVDELETDDDEIQIVKHMIPAPATGNKRKRTEGRENAPRPKKEEG
ncbi:hypothetical protein FRC11_005502 [Ceratobasidium sp. 423]|nr:hypothetical protein FRC11_005502 [Ceratobasidium sp. 423]